LTTSSNPLDDANKRLGWLECAVFLEINGVNATRVRNDGVIELVMWIASTLPDLEDITARLQRLMRDQTVSVVWT
jgi:prophage maintenance system killer protein